MNTRCPYCKNSFSDHNYERHYASCLARPDVASRVKSVLRKISPDGVILPCRRYIADVSGKDGMPSVGLLRKAIGSWSDVAAWAGLRASHVKKEEVWRDARLALIDLGYKLHGGEFGPSPDEWDSMCPPGSPPSKTLVNRFGSWSSVLLWAGGMRKATPEYYAASQDQREYASVGSQRNEARERLLRVESKLMSLPSGLPVVSEPEEVEIYDWTFRRWRKRSVASVR